VRYLNRVAIVLGVLAGVMFIGAYVVATGATTACTTWPGCEQARIPFIDGGPLQSVHWAHRLTVLVGLVAIGWLRFEVERLREPAEGLRFGANVLVGLFVLQIAIGGLNVVSRFAPLALTGHLAVAAGVWVTLVLMLVAGRYAPETDRVPTMFETGVPSLPRLEPRG
jgi:heme A synthase